jgi:hypothetical protein
MRLIYLKSWAKINFIIFSVFTFLILAYILYELGLDINNGGNSWKQGDWLINNETQLVRRGFFGSIILKISDFISINPLVILQWFGQFSGGGRLNDAVITKGFILGAIFRQGLALG